MQYFKVIYQGSSLSSSPLSCARDVYKIFSFIHFIMGSEMSVRVIVFLSFYMAEAARTYPA
jgi:hypothetical protein